MELFKSMYENTKDFHYLLLSVQYEQESFPVWICKAIADAFKEFRNEIAKGNTSVTLDQIFGITDKSKEIMGNAFSKFDKEHLFHIICEIKYLFQINSKKAVKLAWEYAQAWNNMQIIEGLPKPVYIDLGKTKDSDGLLQAYYRNCTKKEYEDYIKMQEQIGIYPTHAAREQFIKSAPFSEKQKALFRNARKVK